MDYSAVFVDEIFPPALSYGSANSLIATKLPCKFISQAVVAQTWRNFR
jgi:hypothetical protein